MAKPALYIDLNSGDSFQFAAGREDTLQIQNLVALAPAVPVVLFAGSTGNVSLGGPASSTLIEGAEISITASSLLDITFTSRSSTLTFNQLGNESLVGFVPAITSIVAALNDVKSAVGTAGLQGAYDIGNSIVLSPSRNLVITTQDFAAYSDFLLRNSLGQNFIQSDTANSEVKLGDGTNIFTNISGHINNDVLFDNDLSSLHHLYGYYRNVSIEGAVTGDPFEPVMLALRGRCNGANSAGADVSIVAEANTSGPRYGGAIDVGVYEGSWETGVGRAGFGAWVGPPGTIPGLAGVEIGVRNGEIYIGADHSTLSPNEPSIYIFADNAPILLSHDGNSMWMINGGGGTTTFNDAYGRVYFYINSYYAGGRVALGSNVWPVAGYGQYFRNLIGTITNVATSVGYQADVALLANVRSGGPDRAGLCVWNADPNGVCYAPRGSLLLRTDTGAAYLNTNDAAAWSAVGMGIDSLQAAYDGYVGGGVQIGLDDVGKDLIIETKDAATYRNFILRKANDSLYLRTDAQNSTLTLGNTNGTTPVGVLLDSNLSWVRDANDRRISLYNESVTQKRTLTVEATRGVANQYGGDLKLWADGSVAHPDATGGGQVEIASRLGSVTRSYLQLNQNGDAVNYGTYLSSYGRVEVVVDPVSAVGSPLNVTNTRGPTTLTTTGGTFTINSTGQTASLDCTVLDVDATAASHVASAATLSVSAANDLTLGARGATITLNQSGDENLDVGFTSTSLIGALNELLGSGGAGTLQQSYNLGNTIGMTTARSVTFTTFDGAGLSDFVVQNALGRIFMRTQTVAGSLTGSVQLGDTTLTDVILAGRGSSLTFNQAGNASLVGFALGTTSLVAALNELKASPSGGVTATYTTAEAVVAGDSIYMLPAGTVGIADYTTVSNKFAVIGISTQSVGAGLPCVVALAGEATVKTALVAGDKGKSAYLDATGNVTTAAPTLSGFTLIKLGVVTASGVGTSKVTLQVGPAVIL